MRYGFVGLAAAFSLTLAGCSLMQPETPTPSPLTEPAFDARIDELESRLSRQCDASEALQNQLDHQQSLTADVREVGGLLRRLRDDVATLKQSRESDPVVVRKTCQADDLLKTKTLVGRSEWVGLPKLETYLQARIDSGAKTSSLSAGDITTFERDGDDWVRFKLALKDDDEVVEARRDEWIEAPIERRVRIIQASGEESRPVISLLMTLGPIRQNVEFTLNDRSHLDYPVLLGRRFLLDIALVDVAQRYVHERPSFDDNADDADKSDSGPDGQDDDK
ncbi:MAG: RimK/LysX family protein [Halomonas sp.]|nr:RimK/LysX family protein [Halomonas sp.]MDN6297341.1 RimK/LysX family protein [Halomonas sp.]MDN6315082.1 RimK/LysX family protein [Halomonas sp.]MDN6337124.1 RimK/LysX family protein [Halomonas sp.]